MKSTDRRDIYLSVPKVRDLVVVTGSLIYIAITVWIVSSIGVPLSSAQTYQALLTFFFASLVIRKILFLAPRSTSIELTSNGLIYTRFWRQKLVRWQEIANVRLIKRFEKGFLFERRPIVLELVNEGRFYISDSFALSKERMTEILNVRLAAERF